MNQSTIIHSIDAEIIMTVIAMKRFDLLDYVDQSRALGVDEKVAKYQARQIEQAIGQAVDQAVETAVQTMKIDLDNKELATKGDVGRLEVNIKAIEANIKVIEKDIKELDLKIEQTRAEIYKSKFDIVICVVGLVAGLFIASGLIQHFLK